MKIAILLSILCLSFGLSSQEKDSTTQYRKNQIGFYLAPASTSKYHQKALFGMGTSLLYTRSFKENRRHLSMGASLMYHRYHGHRNMIDPNTYLLYRDRRFFFEFPIKFDFNLISDKRDFIYGTVGINFGGWFNNFTDYSVREKDTDTVVEEYTVKGQYYYFDALYMGVLLGLGYQFQFSENWAATLELQTQFKDGEILFTYDYNANYTAKVVQLSIRRCFGKR